MIEVPPTTKYRKGFLCLPKVKDLRKECVLQLFAKNSISDCGRILQDKAKNGKNRPWKEHKLQSLTLAEAFERLEQAERALKVRRCGGFLEFVECEHGHERRLINAYFCKDRLCAMCQWRRTLVIFAQIMQVAHEAAKREKLRFLFLTLTCRNVDSMELPKQLDKLFKAWQRLSQRKAFKDNVRGWFRALEITHRMDRDEYHPHFHAILAVRPSYFTKHYIKQEEWARMWQKSLRVDYLPIVDIRAAKPKREGQTVEAAVAEAAKYTVKPGDYLDPRDELGTDLAVHTLSKALKNRRLVAYGGLFKEIRKELNQQDVEEADLVKIDEDGVTSGCNCSVCNSIMQEVTYWWNHRAKNYVAE